MLRNLKGANSKGKSTLDKMFVSNSNKLYTLNFLTCKEKGQKVGRGGKKVKEKRKIEKSKKISKQKDFSTNSYFFVNLGWDMGGGVKV